MKVLVAVCAIGLAASGCANPQDTRITEGAGIGAVGGAVVAGPVGAVVGGGVGAAVADATSHPRHYRCHYSQVLEKRVCHYTSW